MATSQYSPLQKMLVLNMTFYQADKKALFFPIITLQQIDVLRNGTILTQSIQQRTAIYKPLACEKTKMKLLRIV
jgi:hypothetical protein